MPRNTGICRFLAAPGLFPCRPSCALPWRLLRVHWRTYVCPIPSRFGLDPTLRHPFPSGFWPYGFLQPSRNLIGLMTVVVIVSAFLAYSPPLLFLVVATEFKSPFCALF